MQSETNGQERRSCADCVHALAGQFVPLGEAPRGQPGPPGLLLFCARGHWNSVIKATSFYTKPREYREKAADCPDFRATIQSGDLFPLAPKATDAR